MESKILDCLRHGPSTFADLIQALGLPPGSRFLDVSLQTMRRAGQIEFDRGIGRWKLKAVASTRRRVALDLAPDTTETECGACPMRHGWTCEIFGKLQELEQEDFRRFARRQACINAEVRS